MDAPIDTLPPLAPPLVYVIDGQDRIARLNDAYLADIGAHVADVDAAREGLLGQVLWHVLPGVAEWYAPLVCRAREAQRDVCFPFRCDTPELRRLMRMRISADADGHVTFESAIVVVQPRAHVAIYDVPTCAAPVLVTMCSWCKRVDTDDVWLEVEQVMERFGADTARLPALSHGICPHCLAELRGMASSPCATLSIGVPGPDDRR